MILALGLALLGLFCLYLEFFLPGGILAIISGVILLLSIVLFSLKTHSVLLTVVYIFGIIGACIGLCQWALHHVRKSGDKNAFFLQKDQSGFRSAHLEESLVGKEGVVATELKPSGHVYIEGKMYQATSQDGFLSKDTPIEVLHINGSHVVVKLKK